MDQVSEKGGALSLLIPSATHVQFAFGQHWPEAPWFWLAVRTRPRHEKKLKFRASRERNSQLSSALPREAPLERPHSQRVELPMFSQYLFVRVPTSGDSLLQTAGVVQLVGATVRGTPIPDAQMEALLAIVSHGIPTAPREFLRVGQRVRFRVGVLDGIEESFQRSGMRRASSFPWTSSRSQWPHQFNGFEVEPA